MTRATNEPWTSSCQRLRRLAPSTNWVAFSLPGEGGHRFGRVRGDDVVDGATEFGDEFALRGECGVVLLRQAVVDGDVDPDELAADPSGHACRPADQRVTAGDAGHADDHAFAGLPRVGDAVRVEVPGERLLDAVGHPQQGQFAQGAEVAGPEVVGERGVDPFGG